MNACEIVEGFHDHLLSLVESITFDKYSMADRTRLKLYGSMLEFARGICTLIKFDARIGVPSLFRSFLEASVELINLLKDDSYIKNMEASDKTQLLKLLRQAQTGKNPYLYDILKTYGLDDLINKFDADLKKLRGNGRRPLNVLERFEKAGMVNEYQSLYNSLSCDAHSNIRALISRHITYTDSDFEVTIYKDEPIESFIPVLVKTAELLLQVSESLHERYKTGKVTNVKAMIKRLDDVSQEDFSASSETGPTKPNPER